MASMNFARRPVIAGKNLPRLSSATMRGSIRRSDPDGSSASPYFPGASGKSLSVICNDSSGTTLPPVVVTLSSNNFNQILADFNAAFIGASVPLIAFSSDGTITIQCTFQGSNGAIVISDTGGAGTVLGFETFGDLANHARPLFARAGDLTGAAEGRISNPYDAAFPNNNENLSKDSLARSVGRIAGNTDVLWSETAKELAVLKRSIDFTPSTDGSYLTLNADERVFVGGTLDASSSAAEIFPYFHLMDSDTQTPAMSKIVGVVRGNQTSAPPFADSPSYTDTSGKNILGLSQEKTNANITNILEGRYVECSGATFITDSVRVGDLVEITGATNLTPWGNLGKRWVVESIPSEETLCLRPRAAKEVQGDSAALDNHPVVELNGDKSGAESFGVVRIYSGPFADNVTLVVRPPLPPGANYELFVAAPLSHRETETENDVQSRDAIISSAFTSQLDIVENWILFGFGASIAGSDVSLTAGYVRLHGQIYKIPARTITNATFTDNATSWIYWSESTGQIEISTSTTSWTSVLNDTFITPSGKGHPIAVVVKASGTITSVSSALRRRAERATELTIGTGGQFLTVGAAARFANAILADIPAETFPHFEFVLVSDVTDTSTVNLSLTSCSIRSRTKDSIWTVASGGVSINTAMTTFAVYDLQLNTASATGYINIAANVGQMILDNVRTIGNSNFVVISASSTPTLGKLLVSRCSLLGLSGVFMINTPTSIGTPTQLVVVESSTLGCTSASTGSYAMFRNFVVGSWSGRSMTIRDCILSPRNGSTTTAAIVKTSSGASLNVTNCRVEAFTAGSAPLFVPQGIALFDGVYADASITPDGSTIGMAIDGSNFSAPVTVRNCRFRTSGGTTVVIASRVSNCVFTHSGGSIGGTAIQLLGNDSSAVGNSINGPFTTGIKARQGSGDIGVSITGNNITINSVNDSDVVKGIDVSGASYGSNELVRVVSNNMIDISDTVGDTSAGIGAQFVTNAVISSNNIRIKNQTTATRAIYGIDIHGSYNVSVVGNDIGNYGSASNTTSQSITGILFTDMMYTTVADNVVFLDSTVTQHIGFSTGSSIGTDLIMEYVSVTGNSVWVNGTPYSFGGPYNSKHFELSSNEFTVKVSSSSTGLCGIVSNNVFSVSTDSQNHAVSLRPGKYTSNRFDGAITTASTASLGSGVSLTDFDFGTNTVKGTLALTGTNIRVMFCDVGSTTTITSSGAVNWIGNKSLGLNISGTDPGSNAITKIAESTITGIVSLIRSAHYVDITDSTIFGNIDSSGTHQYFVTVANNRIITDNSASTNTNFRFAACIELKSIGSANIVGNYLFANGNAGTGSDCFSSIVRVGYGAAGETSTGITISGNTMLMNNYTPTADVIKQVNLIHIEPDAGLTSEGITISGNMVFLPAKVTVTTNAWTYALAFGTARMVGAVVNANIVRQGVPLGSTALTGVNGANGDLVYVNTGGFSIVVSP